MASSREKLLGQFRELVGERLGRVTHSLMSLEGAPNAEAGREALRELHGLKGEARMMGFGDINSLVHDMEEVVRVAEPRAYSLQASTVDALLVVCDAIQVCAGAVAGDAPDIPRLLAWLKQCLEVETGQPAAPAPEAPGSAPSPAPQPVKEQTRAADASIRITQQSLEVLTGSVNALSQRARQNEALAARRRQLQRELVALHRESEDLGPAAQAFASRLGRAKELTSEIHRRAALLHIDELKELSVLTDEITALRMVPLSVLFEPYPRMVRELAKELGKEVDLVIEGEDERIDRSVLDALKDPLMHLVRNAVDHGLEDKDTRLAARKSPRGVLLLAARREGERLVLRVREDGRGLNPEELRAVAVRRGLLDVATANRLTDAQAVDLIFQAGFSSRDVVTDVSGRGVGLDVVRTRLVSVGGDVFVESAPGEGSTFELRVPVSLTVAPVLFIKAGDEILCLSASNVLRAVLIENEMMTEVAGKPALRIEGDVLPFSSVASLLFSAPERAPVAGELVLVLRGRGHTAAIAVDRVLEERVQAVLPLKGLLSRYVHLSGATPMADGELALVLSAPHLVATVHGRELRLHAAPRSAHEDKRRRVLVVDDSPLTRELLVSLLEAVGYLVVQATDGAQAIDVLGRERVDCVVTDLEMPNVDGLELTRRLKAHPNFSRLPVVIVTTRGSEQDRRRGMEAGADGYVTKGDLVRQDLVDVVGRLMS